MAINPLGSAGLGSIGAGGPAKTESFNKVLKAQTGQGAPLENAPTPVVQQPSKTEATSAAHVKAGKCRVEASGPTQARDAAAQVLGRVNDAQSRMEQILKLAESGKSFSPAELLSLQTHVYRASQELDLAGKVVEKATGGVKQVLQTQV